MKKIISCVLCIVLFCTAFSSSTAAYINWAIGVITKSGSGDEDNKWGLVPYNSYYSQLEGLRVTIIDNSDKSQPFGSVDFTGYNQVNDVSKIRNYSYTNKLAYLKNPTINYMMSKINDTYSAVYNSKFADIDIINCHEIDKIKDLLGNSEFLNELCAEFTGLTFDDVATGKYSIMFEPVAYFTYQGGQYAMTATEVAIFNRYQHQLFGQKYGVYSYSISADAYNAGIANGSISPGDYLTYDGTAYFWSSLRASLTTLTHGNLPRSAYLETEQFGIEPYSSTGSKYEDDDYIISCMGVGFLSDVGTEEEEIPEDTVSKEEYHTDTWVYTTLYFYNNKQKDYVYLVDTSSPVLYYDNYDKNGELTRTSERSLNSSITMYQDVTWDLDTQKLGTFTLKNGIMNGGGAKVKFSISSAEGRSLAYQTVTVGCPHDDFAIVYCKWKTPNTAQKVYISVTTSDGKLSLTDESTADLSTSVRITADVVDLTEKTPPDPTASDKRPSWFKVYKYSSVGENISGIVRNNQTELVWYEWVAVWSQEAYDTEFSSGAWRTDYGTTVYRYSTVKQEFTETFKRGDVYLVGFDKIEHSVSLSADMLIKPDSQVYTATQNANGIYTMKSGYGINIIIDSHLTGETDECTGLQNGNVLFPEFNYDLESSAKYNRLLEEVNGKLQFKTNKYSTYNNRVHFTPIWYPDNKRYAVYAEIFDVWCPAGQLKMKFTDYIIIKGNVYDDWHIAAVKP